jgi:high-affinity K+ transport system ATPase subunit B
MLYSDVIRANVLLALYFYRMLMRYVTFQRQGTASLLCANLMIYGQYRPYRTPSGSPGVL